MLSGMRSFLLDPDMDAAAIASFDSKYSKLIDNTSTKIEKITKRKIKIKIIFTAINWLYSVVPSATAGSVEIFSLFFSSDIFFLFSSRNFCSTL